LYGARFYALSDRLPKASPVLVGGRQVKTSVALLADQVERLPERAREVIEYAKAASA